MALSILPRRSFKSIARRPQHPVLKELKMCWTSNSLSSDSVNRCTHLNVFGVNLRVWAQTFLPVKKKSGIVTLHFWQFFESSVHFLKWQVNSVALPAVHQQSSSLHIRRPTHFFYHFISFNASSFDCSLRKQCQIYSMEHSCVEIYVDDFFLFLFVSLSLAFWFHLIPEFIFHLLVTFFSLDISFSFHLCVTAAPCLRAHLPIYHHLLFPAKCWAMGIYEVIPNLTPVAAASHAVYLISTSISS